MKVIPTAEEFLEKENLPESLSGGTLHFAMIEFAKLHVEAALKEASEKSYAISKNSNFTSRDRELYNRQGLICVHLGDVSVNKDSILNAYPLTNIK